MDSIFLNSTGWGVVPLLLSNKARIWRPASFTMSLLRSQFLVSLTSQRNRGVAIMGMMMWEMTAR